jgi:hypothetical protein
MPFGYNLQVEVITMLKLSLLIVALFLLVGCAGMSCADYVGQADDLLARWDENDQLGGIAPVEQVIETRQALRREAQALSVSGCAKLAHVAMIAYFDQVIDTDLAVFRPAQAKTEAELVSMVDKIQPLRTELDAELDKLRAN